jgi:hypothetical protein
MHVSLMRGRGVALFVRDSLSACELHLGGDVFEGAAWCEIGLKDKDRLVVGIVYRSPNSSEEQNSTLIATINDAVKNKSSHLMVMGDFNC